MQRGGDRRRSPPAALASLTRVAQLLLASQMPPLQYAQFGISAMVTPSFSLMLVVHAMSQQSACVTQPEDPSGTHASQRDVPRVVAQISAEEQHGIDSQSPFVTAHATQTCSIQATSADGGGPKAPTPPLPPTLPVASVDPQHSLFETHAVAVSTAMQHVLVTPSQILPAAVQSTHAAPQLALPNGVHTPAQFACVTVSQVHTFPTHDSPFTVSQASPHVLQFVSVPVVTHAPLHSTPAMHSHVPALQVWSPRQVKLQGSWGGQPPPVSQLASQQRTSQEQIPARHV
jgi:hypothetical protein